MAGRRLPEAPTAVGTVWHHEVLHRRLGGLRAASRCRTTSGGEGAHAENREHTPQSADSDQAVSPSDNLLLEDGTYARSRDWAIHQPIGIRATPLSWNQHL